VAEAPLPDKLPGEVFALEWNRDKHVFILHIQDADASSYNLSGDIPAARACFRRWGCSELGDRAIDIAKEFGAVKASLVTGRAVAVFPRGGDRTARVSFEEETDGPQNLPSLRSHM
jgi:hypothetical protein